MLKLTSNTEQALTLLNLVNQKNFRHTIGLQARSNPTINYLLGDFIELSAFLDTQSKQVAILETNELITATAPDNVAYHYTDFYHDITSNTHKTPDFETGVKLHKLFDGIRASSIFNKQHTTELI